MSFVSQLSPQALWRHFDEILGIPRGSGKEEGMRRYVLGVAGRHGLEHRADATGNLLVVKPGSAGREAAPATILQSHLDMVNEKNSDVTHDFERDPIVPRRDGEFLAATGTTLGSDNGIGVAAMLAVAEDASLVHGPLELLFTIDEERGLTGASGLDPSLLTGTRLLNLDSEEEGVLTVGCAGGADSRLALPLASSPVATGSAGLAVRVAGLKGGHSGVDIHLQRGNALKLLARALFGASLEVPLRLAGLAGGDKTNAIPREGTAHLVLAAADRDRCRDLLERELAAIREELRPAEPGLTWEIGAEESPGAAWDAASSSGALALLNALPHGVLAMSYDIPGLVETSTNLARVTEADGKLAIAMSNRSSVASALKAVRQRNRAIARLAGAEVAEGAGYPGWKPNLDSPLLAVMKRTHQEVLGFEPQVGAIHAGLECGIIGEKQPGLDMISFGPTIQFPHSPDERVKIDTVGRFYELLTATLETLAA